MDTASHIPNIRRIYNRLWQDSSPANPGKVSTCVQVGVRPETTRTLETMPGTLANVATFRARLAGVGRVDVFNRNSCCAGFVFDKGLQLAESPAVEPATHPFASLDSGANVRQVLHRDLGNARCYSRMDDGFARFVIDVFHAPRFLAGDLPELLYRALAAVGLETTTQGKVTVALVAQLIAAKDLAQADGCEIIFSDIHAHHETGCHLFPSLACVMPNS